MHPPLVFGAKTRKIQILMRFCALPAGRLNVPNSELMLLLTLKPTQNEKDVRL
jgi:hypothetical protein